MSVLEAIFSAIDARLAALPGLASYERMPSGDPSRFPALVAYDDGDEPDDEQETAVTRLRLAVVVEGYVEGHGGASAHNALNALHAAAVKALCDQPSTNLGGLVENIEIGGIRRVDIAELANKRRLAFSQPFIITYATKRGDPAVAA